MEKYIGKCLDSLLIPEFDQVEVLVVNDGSKDRSSEIAHGYADSYPESIRVIDKPNGNYGSCINAALPQATGRYVKILDADDTFDTLAFSNFLNQLTDIDADVVFTKCQIVDENGCNIRISEYDTNKVSYGTEYNEVENLLRGNILMHWIAYNKRVFDRFDYSQPEGVSYTDNIWAYIPSAFCKSCLFKDIVLYRYLVGRSGQTVSETQMSKSVQSFMTVAESMLDYCLKYSEKENVNIQIQKNTIGIIIYVYSTIFRFKTKDNFKRIEQFDKKLAVIAPDVYKAINEYPLHKKVGYKLFKHFRGSGYSLDFKIPFFVNLRYRFFVYLEVLIKKIGIDLRH